MSDKPEGKRWFYYLHTNGSIIGKNPVAVDSDPEYFDSPFVRKVWETDSSNRRDAWIVVIESLALGCNIEDAKSLAKRWGLTLEDSAQFLARHTPNDLQRKGMKRFVQEILHMDFESYLSWMQKNGERLLVRGMNN